MRSAICMLLLIALAPLETAEARVPAARLVFARYAGFSHGISSIRPSGDEKKELTQGEHLHPQWSPDRSMIAFASARRGALRRLHVMNANGSAERDLSPYGQGYNVGGFDWSPDGSKIVYAFKHETAATFDIFLVDVGSGESTQLIEAAGNEYQPRFSPDGSRIVFTADLDAENLDIYSMDADGSSPARLTEADGVDHEPRWSPDGTAISFISWRDDTAGENGPYEEHIYRMDTGGEAETRLTEAVTHNIDHSWSPDGEWIAFISWCDDDVCARRETDLHVVPSTGGRAHNLTTDPSRYEEETVWSPDSKWIAFSRLQKGGRARDIKMVRVTGDKERFVTRTPRRAEADLDWS